MASELFFAYQRSIVWEMKVFCRWYKGGKKELEFFLKTEGDPCTKDFPYLESPNGIVIIDGL